ncbi:MAG: rRNA maturation RNase YbeY [Planctomycetes bacterium]|nr:rRNA maturation RNase YbeY [Planctomycetota bacterium]
MDSDIHPESPAHLPNPGEHIGEIDIALDVDDVHPPDTAFLEAMIRCAATILGVREIDLGVVIVDDDAMAQMHVDYLDVEGTTDVITFDLSDETDDHADACVEGELYLCLDEARRRAAAMDHPVDHELLLYAIHGLLHLLGYDDHDPADHAKMHAREDEVLTALGIGAVFARREGGDAS